MRWKDRYTAFQNLLFSWIFPEQYKRLHFLEQERRKYTKYIYFEVLNGGKK